MSDLVYLICSGDFIAEQTVSECLAAEYDYPPPLVEGVERLLCERGFNKGVERLFDSSKDLLALVQFVEPSYSKIDSKADAIDVLLQKLNLTSPPLAKYPLGAALIETRIAHALREMKEWVNTGRLDRGSLRRKPLDGWTYVEHVLKSALNFYTAILIGIDNSADEKFERAERQRSLGPMFRAIQSIEEQFQLVQDATKSADSNDSKGLIRQSQRLYGRKSPFAGFSFWKHRNVLREYRNFFAHATPEMIDSVSITIFRKSLEAALSLVRDLLELEIAPSVIYITAHGWDEFGRGTVWFVDEQYATMNSSERYAKELRMFKPNPGEFQRLQPYMTVTLPKDQIFDPPLVPLRIEGGVWSDETI